MKKIKIDIKKKDGEYCVRWLESGDGVGFTRIEPKCYYTTDKEDAELTAKSMKINWLEKSLYDALRLQTFTDKDIDRILELRNQLNEIKERG